MSKEQKNRTSLCGSGFDHIHARCETSDPHPIKSIIVPNDVLFVWNVQQTGYAGAEVYNKCREIKEKYPEWFK